MKVRQLLVQGGSQRTTGRTKMNENSSRSHAVFTIIIEKSITSSSPVGDLRRLENGETACSSFSP